MTPHLLHCQGLEVDYYGFVLGHLGSGASSTFAQVGLKVTDVFLLTAIRLNPAH